MHRAVHVVRLALLEISAAAASDENAVAGERHGFVVEHITHAAMGVPRRRADFEIARAKTDLIAMLEVEIRALRTARLPYSDAASHALLQEPCARDMIGVNVGIKRVKKLHFELV